MAVDRLRSLALGSALALTTACASGSNHAPIESTTSGSSGSAAPVARPSFPEGFDGPATRVFDLSDGVFAEILHVGDGVLAEPGQRVLVDYVVLDAQTGEVLVDYVPQDLTAGDTGGNPFHEALQRSFAHAPEGTTARISVPAAFFDYPGRRGPEPRPVWITMRVLRVADPVVLATEDDLRAAPIRAELLDDGTRIEELRAGEGPAAEVGDQVEYVILELAFETPDGSRELPVTVSTDPMSVQVVDEFLVGVRRHGLRRITRPGTPDSPGKATMTIQVTDVRPRAASTD